MDQTLEWARLLHDTPDLFPWVCLALVIFVVTAQHKRIFAYFDARIDAYKAKQQSDAVLAELIRNNTAALNNNTAALESVKQDRGESRRMIQYHENVSKERMNVIRDDIAVVRDDLGHVQTVINDVRDTVSQNERDITVLKDRDHHRR